MRPLPALLAAACLVGLAPPLALAGGGVIEIDQVCATTTGCFAGDDPLFPVTISSAAPARSFVLTSDLVLPDAETSAITISQENVTIDFNGFAVIGPVVCSGFPVDCTPSGLGKGVDSTAGGASVRGGSVRGVGSTAVDLDGGGLVEDMRIYENRGTGIRVPSGIARNNVVYRNRGGGISMPRVARGNSVEQNWGTGIALNTGVAVDNTVYQNGGDGISSSGESTIRSNSIARNGLVTVGHGIDCDGRCNVIDNDLHLNSGYGIDAATTSLARTSYHGNRIADNTLGVANGQVVDQGQNLCTSSNLIVVCP